MIHQLRYEDLGIEKPTKTDFTKVNEHGKYVIEKAIKDVEELKNNKMARCCKNCNCKELNFDKRVYKCLKTEKEIAMSDVMLDINKGCEFWELSSLFSEIIEQENKGVE